METTSTEFPPPCDNAGVAYFGLCPDCTHADCTSMSFFTESFYGTQIAGLHCIATKLEVGLERMSILVNEYLFS